MKVFSLARYAAGIALGVALLAGCSANGTTPSVGGQSVAPMGAHGGHSIQDLNKMFAMTNAKHMAPGVQHPLAKSWHIKPPPGTSGTTWNSDIDYASVDEIAYPSGTLVGQVAGFSYPYGLCSDTSGNVYVADFSFEELFEISGGSVVNSWSTGGESIGCSVANNGDVSVTNFYPGGVKIVAGPDAGASYPGPGYDWPAGFDKSGNLYVECNYQSPCSSPGLYKLVSGSWQHENFNQAINFPAAVQQYGKKYMGVADQAYPGNLTGIWLTKFSGSTASASKAVVMGSTGCSTYMDDSSSWGEVGKKPNGLGPKKVKGLVAPNLWCFPSPVNTYGKKGGTPTNQWVVLSSQYDYGTTFTSP
jgi:hypothetical protein